MHHYNTAIQLLAQAKRAFAQGREEEVMVCFLSAEDTIDLARDPSLYLAFGLQEGSVIRDLFMPEGETTPTAPSAARCRS